MHDLSIILNIKNRNNLFRMTADSMLYHCTKTLKDYRVQLVVADDRSEDDLLTTLKELSRIMEVKIVHLNTAKVFPDLPCYSPVVGLNAGVVMAGGENLLFIQPETLFLKNNIEYAVLNTKYREVLLAEAYGGTPEFATVANRLFLQSIDYNVMRFDTTASYTNRDGMIDNIYPYVVATTKETMYEMGLLDVRYMGGWAADDDDWMLRHRRAGHTVRATASMGCYHLNHNVHDANGRVINLHGSPLHVRNSLLLQKATAEVNWSNVMDNLDRNYDVTIDCIESVEYVR